jgi:hypothetical protein
MNLGIASGRAPAQIADLVTDATTIPGVFRNGEAQSAAGLTRVAKDLAQDVRPGSKVTPVEAGEAVYSTAMSEIAKYANETHNASVRIAKAAKQHPGTVVVYVPGQKKGVLVATRVTMDSPVPVYASKVALADEYRRWLASPIEQRQYSAEFSALETLMKGQDYIPLEDALNYQSAFGRMTEGTGPAGSKTAGEGMASHAYGIFNKAVKDKVQQIGATADYTIRQSEWQEKMRRSEAVERVFPDKGKSVINKKPIVEFAEGFLKLTRPDSRTIGELTEMAAIAPAEMPMVGRAILDRMFDKATSKGGWTNHQYLRNKWDSFGKDTKALLYTPAQIKNLDLFFTLSDAIGKRVNPSGTGAVNASFQMAKAVGKAVGPNAAAYGAGGLPALMMGQARGSIYNMASYSPNVVRALVQGKIPLQTPALLATGSGVASQAGSFRAPVMTTSPMVQDLEDGRYVVGPDGQLQRIGQ